MALIICKMCNEQLGFDFEIHVCDPKKIEEYVEKLRRERVDAENRLEDIRDAVFMTMKDLPSLENEEITIKTAWLRKLWDSANCRWYDATTADSFLSEWLVTHMVLCEAFDLFRLSKGPLLKKLKRLKEACDDANKRLEYKADFNLSPEDICKERNDT